jgi:outer membrane lipoprotein-sorting protein
MDNMRTLSILLVTLFTFNVFAQDTEEGMYDPAAKKILDKVSQKYNGYKAMKVDVSLNTINRDADINNTSEMKIILSGTKYQIHVDEDLIMYCDGASIWNINTEDKEGTIEEYEEDASGEEITPSNIWTIYEKGFQYSLTEQVTEENVKKVTIDLAPENKDLDYFKIRMVLNEKTHDIISMRIFAKDGTHYVYTLKNFEANPSTNDDTFKYNPANHPGVEMEDMR